MLQSALKVLFPDQCLGCGAMVAEATGLCGTCWRDAPFLGSGCCGICSHPVLVDPDDPGDVRPVCDTCLATPRPWTAGRAALRYDGFARKLILRLKHGDRTDLAPPAARWMAAAGQEILTADTVLVPVPIHWRRLFNRRFNQAAELARALSSVTGRPAWPEALWRRRATAIQDGMSREERVTNLQDAIVARQDLSGQRIVLVDDVLTTGATLAAAAQACKDAGAARVDILVLARATKSP